MSKSIDSRRRSISNPNDPIEALESRRFFDAAIGLSTYGELVKFDTASPGSGVVVRRITGLQSGESILSIDYRPANGLLYGLGNSNRLYTLNTNSGAATQVGSGTFSIPLSGSVFDIDFNPTVDRIRVVSNSDQNLRLNPDTGAVVDADMGTAGVQADGTLAFAGGDANAGDNPFAVGAAYTNNFAGATTTTLFDIDASQDVLLTQNPANAGTLQTVGGLTLDSTSRVGFDIVTRGGTNAGVAAVQTSGSSAATALYNVNLTTGALTQLGALGTNRRIRSLAVAPPTTPVVALSVNNELIRFNAETPGTISRTIPVTGLQGGEKLLGIDVRPATGALYGLGDSDRLYTINASTGAATQVGTTAFSVPLRGTTFGFDFNPTVDRIRVVSNAEQNLRLNPDTGAVVDADIGTGGVQEDGTLAFAGGDANAGGNPLLVGSAYTNSVAGATATTLYNLSSQTDDLITQNPANAGTLQTVGDLGVDAVSRGAFDITSENGANAAYAILQLSGSTANVGLYTINLDTGAATLVATLGTSRRIVGMAML